MGVEGAFEVASAMPCSEVEPSKECPGAAPDAFPLNCPEADQVALLVGRLGGRQAAGPAAGGVAA